MLELIIISESNSIMFNNKVPAIPWMEDGLVVQTVWKKLNN